MEGRPTAFVLIIIYPTERSHEDKKTKLIVEQEKEIPSAGSEKGDVTGIRA